MDVERTSPLIGECASNTEQEVAIAGASCMGPDDIDENSRESLEKCKDVLPASILLEEERLREERTKNTCEWEAKKTRVFHELDKTQHREESYMRLKFLLTKSNMYTDFLLKRMERQAEEEKNKRRQRQKKLQAKAEQKQKEEQKNKEVETSPLDSETSKPLESIINTPRQTRQSKRLSQQSPALKEKNLSTSKRGRKRKNLSQEESSQEEVPEQKSSKNKKRKCDENSDLVTTSVDTIAEENKQTCEVKVTTEEEENRPPAAEKSQEETTGDDTTDQEEPGIQNGQPMLVSGATLRDYQKEGFHWLKVLYENGVNGILADEMGLGKTIQCISLLSHLIYMGVRGPFIVVAPLSTLPNWLAEFQTFSPKVPVILYHGSKETRQDLRSKFLKKFPIRDDVVSFPVIITSYEIAMNDRKLLQGYQWRYLIVDEGHRIKNSQCRLIRELKMYTSSNRLLLTGTPLQNNLSELWSLLNFLLPEIFDDLGSFESWFDINYLESEGADEKIVVQEQKKNVLGMLHQILTPFMLRRLKSDVDLQIPPKREVLLFCPLTKLQQEFYRKVVDGSIVNDMEEKKKGNVKVEFDAKGRPMRRSSQCVSYSGLAGEESDDKDDVEDWMQTLLKRQAQQQEQRNKKDDTQNKARGSMWNLKLTNVMMMLRHVCNHPYLIEWPLDPDTGDLSMNEALVSASGKLMMLDRMLPELKSRGHKVLIFSQMTKILNIMEDFCHLRKYSYCRLDGAMKVEDRKEQMHEFRTNQDMFIFLLSTKAGGLGINLVAADTVIIFDSDWNPQGDLQAQDRCHRIGQTKPVMVYRMVAANTIDHKIVERAAAKRKLEKMVIHKGKFKSAGNFRTSIAPISPQELMALLKSTDYDEVKGDDKEVVSKQDLDRLLDRSDLHEQWLVKKNGVSEEKKTHGDQVKSEVKSKDVEGLFKVLEDERGVLSTKTDNDDDTADAPNDDTADVPKDNTADTPNDDTADVPKDNTADTPNDDTADVPKDNTADALNDDTADVPKDNTADASNATRTDADAPDDPRL